MTFQLHQHLQQEATREREMVDAELKAREARRKTEGVLATSEEQKEEEIMRRFRPSTINEARNRVVNRMAQRDHEEGIGGSRSRVSGLPLRTNPDRWRQGDPDDMKVLSDAFEREQRENRRMQEAHDNRPEVIAERESIKKYRSILEQLEQAHQIDSGCED